MDLITGNERMLLIKEGINSEYIKWKNRNEYAFKKTNDGCCVLYILN